MGAFIFRPVHPSRWPSLKEVASVVVQVMNDRVPTMSMYCGRQSGWPMTIEDILEPSNQRIHADARHLVTLIMLDNVLEEKGMERKRIPKRKLARMMDRDEFSVRNSEMVARNLLTDVQDYRDLLTESLGRIKAVGFTLIESSATPK